MSGERSEEHSDGTATAARASRPRHPATALFDVFLESVTSPDRRQVLEELRTAFGGTTDRSTSASSSTSGETRAGDAPKP